MSSSLYSSRLVRTPSCVGALLAFLGAAAQTTAGSRARVVAWLMATLEERFPRAVLTPQDTVTGIIALGGGKTARTIEAIRLARLYPNAKLVVTGAADADYELARAQSFDATHLILEQQATNTFENAHFTKRIVTPNPAERWLLVTSATHMPRAIGSFRSAGFPVDAWPIYDVQGVDGHAPAVVQHEYLGLLAYRLLRRTDVLFPGPLT